MDYRDKIQYIRSQFLHGQITEAQAKVLIEPMLKNMNKKGEEVARKFGKKFHPITFRYVMR